MSTPAPHEVYALRLGSVDRSARSNFLAPGDREGPMTLDFTMWMIRGASHVVAVDSGFSEYSGAKRNRTLTARPAEALRRLGVEPEQVGQVVLTHLHYDHAGNLGDFPAAQVVLQAEEMRYATGPAMGHASLNHFFEVEDVVEVLRGVHSSRVRLVDGDVELTPGLEVHLIGGHTRGLQVVRVFTERGWIVLASDAMHYYANLHERNPFPAIVDLQQMLDGYDRILELADGPDHIVPGHDPAVFDRHPPPSEGMRDVVALHLPPQASSPST